MYSAGTAGNNKLLPLPHSLVAMGQELNMGLPLSARLPEWTKEMSFLPQSCRRWILSGGRSDAGRNLQSQGVQARQSAQGLHDNKDDCCLWSKPDVLCRPAPEKALGPMAPDNGGSTLQDILALVFATCKGHVIQQDTTAAK